MRGLFDFPTDIMHEVVNNHNILYKGLFASLTTDQHEEETSIAFVFGTPGRFATSWFFPRY